MLNLSRFLFAFFLLAYGCLPAFAEIPYPPAYVSPMAPFPPGYPAAAPAPAYVPAANYIPVTPPPLTPPPQVFGPTAPPFIAAPVALPGAPGTIAYGPGGLSGSGAFTTCNGNVTCAASGNQNGCCASAVITTPSCTFDAAATCTPEGTSLSCTAKTGSCTAGVCTSPDRVDFFLQDDDSIELRLARWRANGIDTIFAEANLTMESGQFAFMGNWDETRHTSFYAAYETRTGKFQCARDSAGTTSILIGGMNVGVGCDIGEAKDHLRILGTAQLMPNCRLSGGIGEKFNINFDLTEKVRGRCAVDFGFYYAAPSPFGSPLLPVQPTFAGCKLDLRW